MSNKAIILTYLRYFTSYLHSYLTKIKEAKGVRGNLASTTYIKSISAKVVLICNFITYNSFKKTFSG